MKKLTALIICIFIVISVFAACGGTEKDTESKTEAKTEGKTEEKTEAQTEAKTEAQTESQIEAMTEGQEQQTEKQTEAQTEEQQVQNPPTTDGSIPNSEEGKITFAKWDEEGWSPIYVIPESMYNTLVYDGEKYEIDGITWRSVDTYKIYLGNEGYDGNNYGMTWEGFVSSYGPTFFGVEDAALGYYTAKYDINGDGKDEYLGMMRYVGFFADPTVGGWTDVDLIIDWEKEDGSYSEPIKFLMVVTNPDFY